MPEDSGTGADGAASRRPGAPGIFVGVWRKGMSGEKGNAQYFPDAQRWFEQISPTIARMRLLFHEDTPPGGGETLPGGQPHAGALHRGGTGV